MKNLVTFRMHKKNQDAGKNSQITEKLIMIFFKNKLYGISSNILL